MGDIRTWHAPDSTKEAERAVFGQSGTSTAPKPPAKPATAGPAPTASAPTRPHLPARPQRPEDDLGWLRTRIGRRLDVTLTNGSTMRGLLAKVSRYELVLRDSLDRPREVLVMKHAVSVVREAGND